MATINADSSQRFALSRDPEGAWPVRLNSPFYSKEEKNHGQWLHC